MNCAAHAACRCARFVLNEVGMANGPLIGDPDGHPYFIEDGETFPSLLSAQLREECVAVANVALDAIGFDFGPSHVELCVTRDGPTLIEVNAPMAGAAVGDLIETATGINLQLQTMRLHSGLDVDRYTRRGRGIPLPNSAGSRCLQ